MDVHVTICYYCAEFLARPVNEGPSPAPVLARVALSPFHCWAGHWWVLVLSLNTICPQSVFSICLSLQTSVLVKPVTHPGPFLQWLMTQQSRALPIPSPASCLLNFKHWKSNRYTLWPLTVVWQRSWRRPGRRWLRKLGERWEAGRVVPDKVPHSIMGLSPL